MKTQNIFFTLCSTSSYSAFPYAKNNIYSDPLTLIPTISYTIFSFLLALLSFLYRRKTFRFPSITRFPCHTFRSVNFFSFIHISIFREWWRKSVCNDSDHHHFFSRFSRDERLFRCFSLHSASFSNAYTSP